MICLIFINNYSISFGIIISSPFRAGTLKARHLPVRVTTKAKRTLNLLCILSGESTNTTKEISLVVLALAVEGAGVT